MDIIALKLENLFSSVCFRDEWISRNIKNIKTLNYHDETCSSPNYLEAFVKVQIFNKLNISKEKILLSVCASWKQDHESMIFNHSKC